MMKVVTVAEEDLRAMITEIIRAEIRLVPRKRKKPYTGIEVDTLFEISSPTRHAWAKKGLIDRVTVGGRIYYSAESVEKHFQSEQETINP